MPPTNRSLSLPCGRRAVVRGFNGTAQRIINDLAEAGADASGDDLTERLLAEVVEQLDGKRPTAKDFLALYTGSRHRLLTESRRLSYGDTLRLQHLCADVDCGKVTNVDVDLGALEDLPYPADRWVKFGVHHEGADYEFSLTWPTGQSALAFLRYRRQKLLGVTDEPLARVMLNGKAIGPQLLLQLPAEVLDQVRRAGRCMIPTRYLEGEESPETAAPGTVVMDPRQMPRAGMQERVRVRCEHCGHVGVSAIVVSRDFLFRGTVEALED